MAKTRWTRILGLVAAVLGFGVGGICHAASPSLSVIQPRGCQRGAETVLRFSGARLDDAEEIFFYHPGIEVTKLEIANDKQLNVHVKVSPDCRLGEHVAQVRTKSGISEFRTFYVGPFGDTPEKEPNTEFESPQPVPLNTTVTGIVQNEDVDYFVVEAKKGQRIAVEIEGMRLATTMFDPYVAILDERRFELAAADDTPLVQQDAVAAVIAPEDGKYTIEVRESAYGGNGSSHYRLHVGTFPRPTAVFPAGGKLGEEIEVRFLGDPSGEFTQKIQLPTTPDLEFGLEARIGEEVAPSLNPFRLFEHGNAFETEPNNSFQEATPAELPLAFNGIISEPGDVDVFRFAAKKGEVYEVECYARRVRSELDAVMNIYQASGKGVAGNDDSRGPDPYIRFTAPEDGEYLLRITDHLSRGGGEFVYRVEFAPVKPQLTLGIPRVARYSQYRQWVAVPRGNKFATLLTATRANFGGDLVLNPEGLPQGVTLVAEPMPSNMNSMPVLFEAAADAPIGGRLVDFTASHADPNTGIRGGYENRADYVISNPGQSLYAYRDVNRLPVIVVEEAPFRLEIVEPKVPLVQNGSMELKIVAHRQEGFDAAINVQFPFRPPGLGTVSSVNIPKGQNEIVYPLNAAGNARTQKWKVYALGSADAGKGTVWVASQLANLEIAPPFITLAMQRSATEQGQSTQIVCEITHNQPFEGSAKVTLVGLPPNVTTTDLEFTKDTSSIAFPIETTEKSPAGTHKNISCQVVIMQNGEPVTHRLGSTELRIDKPLPKPTTQPKPEPAKVAEKKPEKPAPVKQLTRLEQLRLEAKQRAEAEAAGGGR